MAAVVVAMTAEPAAVEVDDLEFARDDGVRAQCFPKQRWAVEVFAADVVAAAVVTAAQRIVEKLWGH